MVWFHGWAAAPSLYTTFPGLYVDHAAKTVAPRTDAAVLAHVAHPLLWW